jgi:hypothetical protein
VVIEGLDYYTIFVQRAADNPSVINVEFLAHGQELVNNQKYVVSPTSVAADEKLLLFTNSPIRNAELTGENAR